MGSSEFLGHRRYGGYVRPEAAYGGVLLRVDVPAGEDGEAAVTIYQGVASVYSLTPCSEEAARAVARRNRPEPVQRWELPPAVEAATERRARWCDACDRLHAGACPDDDEVPL